jgi:hypothetical protein
VKGDPNISGAFTPYCHIRSNWLELILELDSLIDRYCTQERLSHDARIRVRHVRNHQPLTSIPAVIEFFKSALGD